MNTISEELRPLDRSFQRLLRELDGVSLEELGAFRVVNWPRHVHWNGEDGSISGIIRHVGRWKSALASALSGAGATREPDVETPDAMTAWILEGHRAMMAAIEPYAGSTPLPWLDHPVLDGMDFATTVDVFQDHDRYHAAQIAYLRQRYLACSKPPASEVRTPGDGQSEGERAT